MIAMSFSLVAYQPKTYPSQRLLSFVFLGSETSSSSGGGALSNEVPARDCGGGNVNRRSDFKRERSEAWFAPTWSRNKLHASCSVF